MLSGIAFFNSNQESRLQDAPVISFKNTTNSLLITLKDHKSGRFTVTGKFKWTGEQEEKQVGERQGQPACVKDVREALLADSAWQVPISIWGDLIPLIKEDIPYKLTSVKMRWYFGQKMTTTPETTMEEIKETPEHYVDWEANQAKFLSDVVPKPALLELTNPKIINAHVNSYPLCTKASCGKKLAPFPGELTVRCTKCQRKMVIEDCLHELNVEIDVKSEPKDLTLTIFSNVLDKLFEEDVITAYKDSKEILKDKILFLKNIDLIYNSKKIVTSITYNNAPIVPKVELEQ